MADEQATTKRPARESRRYKVLNLVDPELFGDLMRTVKKRKLGKMTLAGAVRRAIVDWIAGTS